MKLNPEGVEKAARGLMINMGCEPIENECQACVPEYCSCRKAATAALTAYFDHLKESGKMTQSERCSGCGSVLTIEELRNLFPKALSCCPERKMCRAFIIKQEE